MKKKIILFGLFFIACFAFAQQANLSLQKKTSPFSTTIQTGIETGTALGNNHFFTSYVYPLLTYAPEGKWSVITGVKAETSTFTLPTFATFNEKSGTQQIKLNRYSMLIGANYKYSDKLNFSGIFKYTKNQWNAPSTNPNLKNYLPSYSYSALVGFDYKVSDNIHIEGSFQYRKNESYQPLLSSFDEQFYPFNVFSHSRHLTDLQ
jgi:hypothetical protein